MGDETCPFGHKSPDDYKSDQQCPIKNDGRDSEIPTSNNDTNLSGAREKSSIPSTNGEWYYPSPSQFYKSVRRKGHHSIDSTDIPIAVKIHNEVNEESWRRIMQFENLHINSCPNPKLVRFVARPEAFSLKARLNTLIGFESPFDRHDWYVDRCGQKIRYIIDFYDGQPISSNPINIYLDVRPAVSVGGIFDYILLRFKNFMNYTPNRDKRTENL